MKPTASVSLTQEEANLLLRLLESSLGHPATDKNVEADMHRIWDKIFDSGLDAGFGEIKGQSVQIKHKHGII